MTIRGEDAKLTGSRWNVITSYMYYVAVCSAETPKQTVLQTYRSLFTMNNFTTNSYSSSRQPKSSRIMTVLKQFLFLVN